MIGINTIWVLISVISLSATCSLIGCYIMLFKQSLTADAVSHATLPGVVIGFFVAFYFGLEDGRYLPFLLIGAALTGWLCTLSINAIVTKTRLTEDTAIASTLSVFFGFGILMLSIVQNMSSGNRSGLDSFLLGQVSGLTSSDTTLISVTSLLTALCALKFHKQFILQSFDRCFASLINSNSQKSKTILSLLALIIICIGLKAAGAVLILAMLIIPPACARLYSDNITTIITLSILIGVTGATSGTMLSSQWPNIPAGASIVLCNAMIFGSSLIVNKLRTKIWALSL